MLISPPLLALYSVVVTDFFSFPGDNPPHDMWNQTWNSSLRDTQMVVDYLASKFPNVTIYPAIGNHGTCTCGCM